MDITRENYEIWLVDYADGTLSTEERTQVEAFLLLHDDLREEAAAMDIHLSTNNSVCFPHTADLKRTSIQETEDYYAIASAEECTSKADQHIIDKYMMSPLFCSKVNDYRRMRIKPNMSITFPHKERLKHRNLIPLWTSITSAAAIITFIFINLSQQNTVNNIPLPLLSEIQPIQTPKNIVNKLSSKTKDTTKDSQIFNSTSSNATEMHSEADNNSSASTIHIIPETIKYEKTSALMPIQQPVALCKSHKTQPSIISTRRKLQIIQNTKNNGIEFENSNIFTATIATSEKIYKRVSNVNYSKILSQKKIRL